MPKERLFGRVYGPDNDIDAKVTDVILCRLKQRMAKAGIPIVTCTIWGVGVRLMTVIELNPPIEGPREIVLSVPALPPLRKLIPMLGNRDS